MTETKPPNDWDPRSEEALNHPLTTYDTMRRECPVAHSDYLHWSVFRHEDVMQVLADNNTFSARVSRFRSVPNGVDPPEHTPYRALIEPYFSPGRMSAFEPVCREMAQRLVKELMDQQVEVIGRLAEPFALKAQCAFMGWPERLQKPLQSWLHENHKAILEGDGEALAEIAQRFTGYIHELLEERRALGTQAPRDITTELMEARIEGKPLPEEDLVSIMRNWTAGEVGTLSASVGILAGFLAQSPALQQELRSAPHKLPEAIDEILRLHGPLPNNRRITTRPCQLADRMIPAHEKLSIFWVSANRDESVFPEPDKFRWGRDHSKNLLYGAGTHICPGAPLARLELRLLMEALLSTTRSITPSRGRGPVTARYPTAGYEKLWPDFEPVGAVR